MEVTVKFECGMARPINLRHTVVYGEDGKPKDVYRSSIITDPCTGKLVYVEFDPATKQVKVKEVR